MAERVDDYVFLGSYLVRDRGHGTLTVALPSGWREETQVQGGDMARWYQQPGSHDLRLELVRFPKPSST
jgi:hypothetical protein